MTDELKALADLLAKATPGQLVVHGNGNDQICNNRHMAVANCGMGHRSQREEQANAAAIVASVNFLRDNLPAIIEQRAEIERLRQACRYILPYLEWTVGSESPGYHPTMPSAVADFRAALNPTGQQA